jgi:group I intron endonuclease
MSGLIYKATSPNGKIYIGQTSRTLEKRIKYHKYDSKKQRTHHLKFYRAITKYGIDNFRWEIIEDNIDENLLDIKECEWIEKYNSHKEGYNSTIGGNSQHMRKNPPSKNPITAKKISNALKGTKKTKEHCENISQTKKEMFAKGLLTNPMKGKHHSEDSKKKIQNTKKNKIKIKCNETRNCI